MSETRAERRKTPPDVRALWRLASESVSRTLVAPPAVVREVALRLSWSLYEALKRPTESERKVFERLLQEGREGQEAAEAAVGPMPKPVNTGGRPDRVGRT